MSPGASVVPAKALPSITVSPPHISASAMAPCRLMPPSAMSGTSSPSARRHSTMACNCGTPKLVVRRVVQPPPGPMPTFTALAPRSARKRAPSAVATLPAMTSTTGNRFRTSVSARSITTEWPCAMSITSTSTPARINSAARSR